MSFESVFTVTPAELENINKSYGRTKEQIAEDVQLLIDWAKKQPHLPSNEDVVLIERGLKFNKFSVERSKQKSDYYYAAKTFAPEFFQNNNTLHPCIQKVISYATFVPMPKLCPDFGRIFLSKLLFEDIPNFSSTDCLKCILMVAEIQSKFDNQTHNILVFDFINTSFANIMSFHPMDVTKCFTLIIKAFSLRIEGVHILNAPTYAMGLIKLLKNLLSEKMGSRLHVHTSLESLHAHIPKELLPKDYGGNESTLIELNETWVKYLESKNDWMLERANMKSNEKLRIGTPLDLEIFGTEGTFRKINVD